MADTFTWRPTGGYYFNSGGTSDTGASHFYYSSNRAFRIDFPDLGSLVGKDKKTISIASAILRVYITAANSATLTIGYSYKTAFSDRQSMLASVAGINMNTSTGWMDIDLTSVIRAYCRDETNSTICFYLSNEALSLFENAAHIGLPIPDKLREALAQLHGRKDEDDTTNTGDGE